MSTQLRHISRSKQVTGRVQKRCNSFIQSKRTAIRKIRSSGVSKCFSPSTKLKMVGAMSWMVEIPDFCSKTDIFIVRQRSAILCSAYQLALDHMNDWTWRDCCTEVCKQMNRVGFKQATHYKTVADWNIAFQRGDNFPHPNPRVQCGKVPLP